MESGQTIAGKYRLSQLLGAGGMASVWSATNVFTERQVAIKFMLPAVARTQEAARRFLLEAKVSARIDHPNVIEVMDVGQTEDGALFLVMELLNGVSLDTALRRHEDRLSLHDFASIMLEVARALSAAHKRGIIHRDLKPTNIFLHTGRDGRRDGIVPKLLDFGVSKFLDDEGQKSHALTVAGTVLGSPLYMSPEQARGEADIDGRTDIFAFGGILFEALAGRRAYEGANFNQLLVTIATTAPRKIDDFAPQMPESLRAITRDCLVPDRDKRMLTFDAVAERLSAALMALKELPARLPPPAGSNPDTEITNALPLVRPSDRPPPLSLSQGDAGTPWPTPSGISTQTIRHRRRPPMWVAAVAVGVFTLGLVTAGVLLLGRGRKIAASPPPAPVEVTRAVAAAPEPRAAVSSEPPVVSVDALPVARPGASAAKGAGHITVTAPDSCTVSVDGKVIGTAPIITYTLPPGAHQVRCETAAGKAKTATINVVASETTAYRFAAAE